jgi:hypothetical protein
VLSVMVSVIYRQKRGLCVLVTKTVTVAGYKNVCAKDLSGMPRDYTVTHCLEDRSPMTSIWAATQLDDI